MSKGGRKEGRKEERDKSGAPNRDPHSHSLTLTLTLALHMAQQATMHPAMVEQRSREHRLSGCFPEESMHPSERFLTCASVYRR